MEGVTVSSTEGSESGRAAARQGRQGLGHVRRLPRTRGGEQRIHGARQLAAILARRARRLLQATGAGAGRARGVRVRALRYGCSLEAPTGGKPPTRRSAAAGTCLLHRRQALDGGLDHLARVADAAQQGEGVAAQRSQLGGAALGHTLLRVGAPGRGRCRRSVRGGGTRRGALRAGLTASQAGRLWQTLPERTRRLVAARAQASRSGHSERRRPPSMLDSSSATCTCNPERRVNSRAG